MTNIGLRASWYNTKFLLVVSRLNEIGLYSTIYHSHHTSGISTISSGTITTLTFVISFYYFYVRNREFTYLKTKWIELTPHIDALSGLWLVLGYFGEQHSKYWYDLVFGTSPNKLTNSLKVESRYENIIFITKIFIFSHL